MKQEKPKADAAKFVTRGNYKQSPGYPLWLAGVLDDLYAKPPKSGRELVARSAAGMKLDTLSERYAEIKASCGGMDDAAMFGPIVEADYGKVEVPREAFYTYDVERDYSKTIARNYPDEYEGPSRPNTFRHRRFSYPVQGTGRELELMQIGRQSDLYNDPAVIDEVAFRHPALTRKSYKDFLLCMDDLFEKAGNKALSKHEREHAAIASFWLMAQATPAVRGGTAHAKIVLEYVASRAGMAVPHTKEGFDLWAEAACTDLKDFEKSFRAGVFFEPEVTSQKIIEWHQSRVALGRAG